jgi:hypothetical protein
MASGGAGAPPASSAPAGKYVGSIAATVHGGSPAAGAFFLSLFPEQKSTPSSPNPIALGNLSDPDVFYWYDKSSEDPRPETDRDSLSIEFYSSPASELVGIMDIHIKSPTHLDLLLIQVEEEGKGLGKKCMAILEDIAKRKEIKLITLKSFPTRVSFYLGLNSPYAIANNANGKKRSAFNEVYTKRIQKGNAKNNASAAASDSVMGEVELVKMTKTLPRKTRRNRRNRTSRRSRRS